MKSSSVVAAALGAAALCLLAGGASAQSAATRYSSGHHQRPSVPRLPTVLPPAVKHGRSLITPPRSGRALLTGPLVPLVPGAYADAARQSSFPALAVSDLWTSAGPAPLLNGGGAFGGPDFEDGYDAGIGQNTSGRIVGIAADPTNAQTYYVASAGGGVWKTTDAGQSYTPLTDFLGDTAMGSITVAPSNHNVIYAGTGEANFGGDSRYGIGLLKSTDGGASWSVIPGPQTNASPNGVFYRKAISRIAVDPTNPNVVYLGTVLAGLNGNGFSDGGVWKTTDGGQTWTNTTAGILTPLALYTDVVMNTKNPNILYTAVGYPGTFSGNGVFKTTDGGQTWTRLTGGLPLPSAGAKVGGQTTLALYSSASGTADTLYVSIPNSSTQGLLGLYKSADSGATFAKLNAPNYLGGQAFYDNAVVVSQSDPNVFFAAGQVNYGAVYGFTNSPTNYNDLRSLVGTTDGGATFHDFSLGKGYVGPHTDTHALTFTPDGKILDGNDGGIWRLENPTVTNPTPPTTNVVNNSNIRWKDINGNLDTIQFTGIALDPSDAGVAYGGAQDNGTSKKVGSLGWTQVCGGDGGFTRVDASNPQTVYHEYYGISLERSDDGGQTWNDGTNGINPDDPAPDFFEVGAFNTRTEPAAFYVPFKLDPLNTAHVVLATDHVYLSTNKADAFTPIGIPGTNGFAPNALDKNGKPTGAYVDALGIAGQTIYAEIGSHVFATFDNGGTWLDRSIPAVLAGRDPLSDIHVNPVNPLDVYAVKPAFDDYSLGKVFRSTDGGANWADISGNLPDLPFNAIRLDRSSGTLYAAGDDGVYSTGNFGNSWARIPGSLPTVAVTDIDLSGPTGLVGAGTHGRGLWTTPLSKVAAKPNLKLIASAIRTSAGVVQVTLTLSNFGTASTPAGVGALDTQNTKLTVMLNGKAAETVTFGPVAAFGLSRSVTLTFTGVAAGTGLLRYAGTYTGSSFSGSQRISVP